jgi:isopenicillin-N N-acyltransferase-like protein
VPTVTTSTLLTFTRARGSPRGLGRQIGEQAQHQIRRGLDTFRSILGGSSDHRDGIWQRAVEHARRFRPYAEGPYFEELIGTSEGAGVLLDALLALNCAEALLGERSPLRCTSLAAGPGWTEAGRVLLAHNEDWWPEDEHTLYLVHAEPFREPPFLALTYGGWLPCLGLNGAGIAQACDSVYPSDSRVGLPRAIVARSVLGAKDLDEAVRRATVPGREAGYNHLLANREGERLSIETSAQRNAVLRDHRGAWAHTNHYLDPSLQEVESEPAGLARSRIRHSRATGLLEAGRPHSVDSLHRILADHQDQPNSICSHPQPGRSALDQYSTIASVVIDVTEGAMHVGQGLPCRASFTSYSL